MVHMAGMKRQRRLFDYDYVTSHSESETQEKEERK